MKQWNFKIKNLCQKALKTFQANIRLDEDVLKTSWRRLSSLSSEDVLIKTNMSVLVFKASSRRLGQDQYIRLGHTSSRRLAKILQYVFKTSYTNVFKTSSRRLQNIFKTSCQDVFKTSSKSLQDVLQKRLQEIFKTYSRRLAKISSKTFSRRIIKLTVLVNTSSRSIKHVSQTFFSKDGYLQKDLAK